MAGTPACPRSTSCRGYCSPGGWRNSANHMRQPHWNRPTHNLHLLVLQRIPHNTVPQHDDHGITTATGTQPQLRNCRLRSHFSYCLLTSLTHMNASSRQAPPPLPNQFSLCLYGTFQRTSPPPSGALQSGFSTVQLADVAPQRDANRYTTPVC